MLRRIESIAKAFERPPLRCWRELLVANILDRCGPDPHMVDLAAIDRLAPHDRGMRKARRSAPFGGSSCFIHPSTASSALT
jgi:hypothetical protein